MTDLSGVLETGMTSGAGGGGWEGGGGGEGLLWGAGGVWNIGSSISIIT